MPRRDKHVSNGFYLFLADIFIIVRPIIVDLAKKLQVVMGCNTIDEIFSTLHFTRSVESTVIYEKHRYAASRSRVPVSQNQSAPQTVFNHAVVV